jgi:hypothetical protein
MVPPSSTLRPGMNFNVAGFGVASVWMNMVFSGLAGPSGRGPNVANVRTKGKNIRFWYGFGFDISLSDNKSQRRQSQTRQSQISRTRAGAA